MNTDTSASGLEPFIRVSAILLVCLEFQLWLKGGVQVSLTQLHTLNLNLLADDYSHLIDLSSLYAVSSSCQEMPSVQHLCLLQL